MASEGSLGEDPASDSSTVPSIETTATVSPAAPTFSFCGIKINFKHAVLPPTQTTLEVFRLFEERHLDGADGDVVIEIGGTSLRAHKDLLIIHIPYFTSMFEHGFIEKSTGVVNLSTQVSPLDATTIRALIGYCYHGELTITEDNERSLLEAAVYLQMDKVIAACADFMFKRVRWEGVISLLAYFRSVGVHHDRLWRFADANFVPISCTVEFAEMSCDDLVVILQRHSLRIDSEEQVFEAVSRWVDADNKRCKDAPKVLMQVRLPSLRNSFITDVIASKDWVKDNLECMAYINQNPTRKGSRRDRFCNDAVNIVCSFGPDYSMHFTDYYCGRLGIVNPLTGATALEIETSWAEAPFCTQAAVVGFSVYFLGGEEDKVVRVLDTRTHTWTDMPDMPSVRQNAVIQTIDGIIYVAGGASMETTCTTSLIALNTREPNPVFGGSTGAGTDHLAHTAVYDPATNVWTTLSPMARPTCSHSAVAVDGRIIVLGGRAADTYKLRDCNEYEPATDTWRSLPSMAEYTKSRTFFFSSGRLLSFEQKATDMEVFDLAKGEWKKMETYEGYVENDCHFPLPVPAAIPLPMLACEDHWPRFKPRKRRQH